MGERSAALDASDPIRTLVDRLAAADVPCAVRLPDGDTIALGDGPPRFTVGIRSDAALVRLATEPSMLAVGEAFVDGTLDVEGDLLAADTLAYHVAGDAPAPMPLRIAPARRDVAAHYELPSEFYALFLDRRMLYTCAYHPRPDATLDEAQEAKLALVCRKLALAPDERLLDVGCGWGGLVVWAAARHGVRA